MAFADEQKRRGDEAYRRRDWYGAGNTLKISFPVRRQRKKTEIKHSLRQRIQPGSEVKSRRRTHTETSFKQVQMY